MGNLIARNGDPLEAFVSVKQAAESVLSPSLDVCLAVKELGESTNVKEMLESSKKVRNESLRLATMAMAVAIGIDAFESQLMELVGERAVQNG